VLTATLEASVLRLRPIMMTALVAWLRPAAGGDVHRNRRGFAEAVRHRDSLADWLAAAAFSIFLSARALRLGGARRRHIAGMRRPMRFYNSLFLTRPDGG